MVSALSVLPLVSAMLSIVLMSVTLALPPRQTRTTVFFALMNLASALWCIGWFLHMNSASGIDPALAQPFSADYMILPLMLIGPAAVPTFLFLFGAELVGDRRWREPLWTAVAFTPLVFTLLVGLTNPWSHLFLVAESSSGRIYGPAGDIHHLSTFILGTVGFWWCLKSLWVRPGGRRSDAVIFGATSMVPYIGSILWMTRDLTPVTQHAIANPVLQPIGYLVLGALVFRAGFANIIPLGTLHALMENTDTLLGYLDPRLQFVSANSALVQRLGIPDEQLAGHPFSEVIGDPALVSMVDRASRFEERIEQRGWPDALGEEGHAAASYWNWSLRPVKSRGRLQGFVFSLAEVTEEVRDAELSASLSRLTRRLHSTFDPETTLPRILASAGAALDAEASVVLWTDGRWRWVRRCGSRRPMWETFDGSTAPDLRLAIQQRRPVVVSDAFNDPRFDLAEATLSGHRRILSVPLVVHDAVLGAVSFGAPGAGHVGRAELAFGRELARAVAVAVENARMYQSERRIADTLQDAMLSVPERIEGLETAHSYRSATEAARVGGDFYDLFRVGHDHVALLIGDVAGKGIQVAALTSLVKSTIRAESLRSSSAAMILTRTNQVVKKQFEVGTFVTAFIALLEVETGLLRYASAGHPAPFLVHCDGRVEQLGGGSVVLGAFEDVEYQAHTAALERGDLLLMFTDGLIETRKPGAEPEKALGELLSGLACAEPAEVVAAVIASATEALGGKLKDDVAVLAVRLT